MRPEPGWRAATAIRSTRRRPTPGFRSGPAGRAASATGRGRRRGDSEALVEAKPLVEVLANAIPTNPCQPILANQVLIWTPCRGRVIQHARLSHPPNETP